jgi:hypothetical protein
MKLNRTATGEKLYAEIRIRVFSENNKSSRLTKLRPDPGHGYTAEGIERKLEEAVELLDKQNTRDEFELVRIGPADFNFVWRGYRKKELPT